MTERYGEGGWKATHRVVKALYDVLLENYLKIDLAGIERRRGTVIEDSTVDALLTQGDDALLPEDESVEEQFIAAVVQQQATKQGFGIQSSLRLSHFAKLVQALGVEIRNGKGSEIVFYRPEGKHFRIGRHVKDPKLFPGRMRSILRHVGVDAAEWAGVMSRQGFG